MGEYVEGEGACGSVGEGAEEVAEWEMMLFGFGRVPGCLGLGALFFVWVGRDEWRDERTVCQRGGCMVVPGAVVSPGQTRRLSLLPCRAPHNSPCTLMRTWLRQMGLTLRLVAAGYLSVNHLRR